MEESKLMIISDKDMIAEYLLRDENKDIIIVDSENYNPEIPSSPMISEFNPPYVPDLYPEKIFVCKGKHQYRSVNTKEGNIVHTEWICQCGRKITD